MNNMKVYLFLLVSFLFNNVYAQDEDMQRRGFNLQIEYRYLNATQVKYNIYNPPSSYQLSYKINSDEGHYYVNNDRTTYGKGLRVYAGYFFSPKFNLNVGFGAERYEVISANTFPLVLQAKYYFTKKKNSFYVFAEGGPQVSFGQAKSGDSGSVYAFAIGKELQLGKRTALNFNLGYNIQKSIDNDDSNEWIKRQSFLLGVAFLFR